MGKIPNIKQKWYTMNQIAKEGLIYNYGFMGVSAIIKSGQLKSVKIMTKGKQARYKIWGGDIIAYLNQ